MIYFHKILPIFLLTVGVTFLLVLAGLLFRRRALIWTAVVILWFGSTPLVSACLVRAAEGWAERTPVTDASEADAIVVLSEGRVIAPGKAAISEWGDAYRFFGGMELFNAGNREGDSAGLHRWLGTLGAQGRARR